MKSCPNVPPKQLIVRGEVARVYWRSFALALFAMVPALLFSAGCRPFPADTTPQGAYLRLAHAITENRVREAFPYTETETQWASFTIRDARKSALETARASYPPAELAKLVDNWGKMAATPDGADAFALLAEARGYRARLRKDMSGVDHVEIDGERATVVTARGTRYPFRRRENGIWGLTIFSGELLQEAQRASRDLEMVRQAADDYAHARLP